MSKLRDTTADIVTQLQAASSAQHLMRKGEADAALALKSDSGHTHANDHVALTISGANQSLALTCPGQELTGEVRLASDSGLEIVASGLRAVFGTGATQVAAGNHTHGNDHVAATADAAQDNSSTVTVSGQAIKCAVRRKANGGILVDANGLYLDMGTAATQAAAGDHTHANAIALGAAGFMSGTDKAKLDGLAESNEAPLTFEDTATVDLTRTGDVITADVIYGAGLVEGAGGLEVDFDEVAAADHSHSNAIAAGAAGFMSGADKAKLDDLATVATNDAAYVLKGGSATTVQAVATVLTLNGGDGSTPGLNVALDAWLKAKLYIGATADAFLYRSGAGVIMTDTALTVGTTLTVAALSGVLKATAGVVSGSATTADLTEDTNLYFTEARVRGAVLTGFAAGSGDIAATDTVLQAFGKCASKAYVDAVAQGLDVKASCRVATTANIALTGTQTIDGVATLVTGDRILVKNQSTALENGIYVYDPAGAYTRATDADTSAKVTGGMFTFVSEGTANGNNGYVLITDDAITLGTTSLSFEQFSGAGQIIAGTGLTKTGNTLAVDLAQYATIYVESSEMMPRQTAGPGAVLTTETTTNDVMLRGFNFDPTTEEAAQFALMMPEDWNRGTLSVKFFWTEASGSTDGVVWAIKGQAKSDADVLDDTWGTQFQVTDNGATADTLRISAAITGLTVGGSPALHDLIWFQVVRKAGDISDVLAVDAKLFGVAIQYRKLATLSAAW